MNESLSVRAYRPFEQTHSHQFNQIVLPLHGAIEIGIDDFRGPVSVGHCVIIKRDREHSFSAKKDARFLVADIHTLPEAAQALLNPFASVSDALRSFCVFADIQLKSPLNIKLERNMLAVFKHLLSAQHFLPEIDRRVSRAIAHIENDLSRAHKLDDLASIASLSISQFKILFAKYTGMSVTEYLTMLRMEKARALLVNTDTPVSIIAEASGYTNQSAFSRRFRTYFDAPPSQYRKR